jgi:hypothetical protein
LASLCSVLSPVQPDSQTPRLPDSQTPRQHANQQTPSLPLSVTLSLCLSLYTLHKPAKVAPNLIHLNNKHQASQLLLESLPRPPPPNSPFSPLHNQLLKLLLPGSLVSAALTTSLSRPSHDLISPSNTTLGLFVSNTTHHAFLISNFAIRIPRTRRNYANLRKERLRRE